MKSNWSNSAGWMLRVAAVVLLAIVLLAILRRLDLLLIVAPVSVLLGYRLARDRAGIDTVRR